MFQKTKFEYYEDYDTCKITIIPFQIADVIFTSLFLKIELQNNGETVYEVANTKINYLDYSSSDAVCKDIRYIFRIFKRIHLPEKGIDIYIHNLPAFLFLTKQIPASSISMRNWIGLFYKDLRSINKQINVYLGDVSDKLGYEYFVKSESEKKKFTFPSNKYLGLDNLEYIRKQLDIRRDLIGNAVCN